MSSVKTETLAATESSRAKALTPDQQWNVDGLLKAHKKDDSEVVTCTATKTPLFYYRKTGAQVMLTSFGNCAECKLVFHDSYLHFAEGIDRAAWPVEYQNSYCKDCWAK